MVLIALLSGGDYSTAPQQRKDLLERRCEVLMFLTTPPSIRSHRGGRLDMRTARQSTNFLPTRILPEEKQCKAMEWPGDQVYDLQQRQPGSKSSFFLLPRFQVISSLLGSIC